MITQVIFDLDGTLVNSLGIFLKVGNQMAKKYGYQPLDEERIKELMKFPIKQRLEALKIPIYKLPKITVEALSMLKTFETQVEPFVGISEMLKNLNEEGYRLSIVSSNSQENIKIFLDKYQLNLFDNIQSSRGLFDKHITLKKLLSKLDVKNEEVIYVGDEYRDIEACKKVGIKIISVIWGFDPKELLEKAQPDFIASNPNEISEIIKNINKKEWGIEN